MHTTTVHSQSKSRPTPPPPPPARRRQALRVGIDVTFLAAIMDGPRRDLPIPPRVRTPIAFADTIRPGVVPAPSDDSRASTLCERLLARKIVAAAAPPPLPRVAPPPELDAPRVLAPPPPPRAAHEPALIGQEAARRRLDAAMLRARTGVGAALVLRGGGDGTAADLARLAIRGLDPATLSLRGAGVEQTAVPFQVVSAIVGQLAEHLSGLTAAARVAAVAGGVACLARVFPCMEPFVAATPGVALPALTAGCRRRAIDELRALLSAVAADRPVALLLEDVHLCDPDSADLIDALLAEGPPRGVSVLATLRAGAEELAALPRVIESFEAIAVVALPHEEAILYARRRLRAHECADLELAPAIAVASGKRPVLIDLLARLLARCSPAERASLEATPAALDRLLGPVLAAMSTIDRAALELVALDGAPIYHEVVDRAAEQRACYSLDRLCELGLLTTSEDRATLRVTHAQIREAIVRMIPEERRLARRRALADAHRRCARGDLARAAHHCLGADAWNEAAELASEAAKQAKNASAHGLAAELCELALCTDPRSRALRLRLADTQAAAGRFEAAANNRLRVALAVRGGRRLELASQACEHLFLAGRRERGQRTAAMILAELGAEVAGDDGRRRALLLAELATLAAHPLEFREQSRCELGGEILRRLDVSLRMARLLLLEAPTRAGILAARGAQLALLAGEPRLVAVSLALAGQAAAEHDPALAQRLLDRAGEVGRSLEDPRVSALVALCHGLALVGDDGARGRSFLDACVAIAGEIGEEARWEHTLALTARERAQAA